MTTFASRAAEAVGDRRLRMALDRATGQLGSRREQAFASLPDSDAIRDAARAAKLHVVANLAEHLERFEANLLANGARVHWAETSADANRIIANIARETKTTRAVKSKSMVSEETHLNHALEEAGVTVVETDLGEYIVQLGNDRPSHIIAPIIHLTRGDVGRLMQRRLGVPFSDDPGELAAFARTALREEFLRADMGISGANFGVAETGTICIVTNEGNGRMVTTMPRVHVALMGIEKLVPTLADLDRCLKILARSATGQKLTVYTNLIRGPKSAADADGPEELHVVLLDNGRSGILAGDSAEILGCIRCGACLNACPVYRTVGGHAYGDIYPGPVGAIVTPGIRGLSAYHELPHASSLCGACREVCPVRLDIPRMLLALRSRPAVTAQQPRSIALAMKTFAALASHPGLYRQAARAARWGLRRRAAAGWISSMPGIAAGWTKSRDFKAPAERTFQDRWRARR